MRRDWRVKHGDGSNYAKNGQSVESCLFGEWKKAVGDTVEIGDVLFSYETDKATFEEEAKVAGTLLAVLCEPGDDIPCLHTVAVIGEKGEDISSLLAENEEAAPEAPASSVVQAAPVKARGACPCMDGWGLSPCACHRRADPRGPCRSCADRTTWAHSRA